jgi:hypothetical protein
MNVYVFQFVRKYSSFIYRIVYVGIVHVATKEAGIINEFSSER